jgi:hypothetical protein
VKTSSLLGKRADLFTSPFSAVGGRLAEIVFLAAMANVRVEWLGPYSIGVESCDGDGK